MKNTNREKVLRFVRMALLLVVVAGVAGGGWWLYSARAAGADSGLAASGTIEAGEVQIAPEISGKVMEVYVQEGDTFEAGAPLFRLDDELLQTQRKQSAAALQVAQDNLAAAQAAESAAQETLNGAQAADAAAQAGNAADLLAARQQLQDLQQKAGVTKTAAEKELAAATRALRDAQYNFYNFTVPGDQQGLTTSEGLAMTWQALLKAQAAFDPYRNASQNDQTRKDLKTALDNAQSDYDAAVRRLELETARDQALARQAQAQQDLAELQDGPRLSDVALLKAKIAALEQAPAQSASAVKQAQWGVTQAHIRVQQARSAVGQAQAALDALDVQLKKMEVRALTSGVVLSRSIDPGAVAQAGVPVLSVGELASLRLTVYVPEDRYGTIHLGQQTRVSIDSFPARVFYGTVTYIANQAEYTPRNVQTVEGRSTTVFAVRITIANPDGDLKPGMPADVIFEN